MVKEDWRICAKGNREEIKAVGEKYGIDQVIARVVRNREVVTPEETEMYFNGGVDSLHSPWLLKDMDKAVALISEALTEGEKIRIIGDYDIDGITSTYILIKGLKRVRPDADVDFVVPHRVKDGYGINERLIEEAYEDGRRVIITCDNGIAAYDQIKYAKSLGIKVVITDHHDVPFVVGSEPKEYIIPPADAVVNPKQADCGYPWKKICGGVVAYKFIQAMLEKNNIDLEYMSELLEFAAIATVGDVMELQGENRVIVKEGLKRIKHTSNIGLKALIEINKLNIDNIKSYHIGFVIGPCLNASGRLDTAMKAIGLLMSTNPDEACKMAEDLKLLNDERKKLTQDGVNEAISQIENSSQKEDKVLVIYLKNCHESIVGIIAGKIREKYNKPVIVFADGEGCIKGSGRSTEHYNMFEKLSEAKHMLLKFGGHPMAAGMSMDKLKLDDFRKFLNENCGMTEEDLIRRVWIDVPMPFDYIFKNPKVISDLEVLEPTGNGNAKPVFADKDLRIRELRHMGKEGNFTKVIFEKADGTRMEGVYFGISEALENAYENNRTVRVLYYPGLNEYNGRTSLQINILNVKE